MQDQREEIVEQKPTVARPWYRRVRRGAINTAKGTYDRALTYHPVRRTIRTGNNLYFQTQDYLIHSYRNFLTYTKPARKVGYKYWKQLQKLSALLFLDSITFIQILTSVALVIAGYFVSMVQRGVKYVFNMIVAGLHLMIDVMHLVFDLSVMAALAVFYFVEAVVLAMLPKWARTPQDLAGRVALVTGGGGGVGRQLCLQLARQKAIVVVWDIDQEGMETTCSLIKAEGYRAHGYVVDLSDRNHVYKMADLVRSEVGSVHLLVNNAAVAHGRLLMDLDDADIENTFSVNILSHYWTTRAFLGDMIDLGNGHIVTIASVAGLLGTYRCTDYSATKFAACGFHESLFTELKTHGQHNINLTLVCPYYINTGMFAGVKPRIMQMLEPQEVATRIIESILYREVLCVIPGVVRYLLPLKCLLPAKLCWALMYRILQGPQSMMTFRGHNKTKTLALQSKVAVVESS